MSDSFSTPQQFRCPICGKPVDPASVEVKGSPFPFCSQRCRLIDLGRWLDGKYQIPVDEDEQDLELPPDEVP